MSVDHELCNEASRWCYWAFQGDCSLPQRSPSEIMAGGVRGDRLLRPTSTAISRRIHAASRARAQFSRPVIDGRYRGGGIFARINSLPADHIVTLRALYQLPGPDQYGYQIRLAARLHEAYTREWQGPIRAKTAALVRSMVNACIFSARHPELSWGLHSHPWGYFGVTSGAWRKTYQSHWRRIRELFEDMHCEAVLLAYEKRC